MLLLPVRLKTCLVNQRFREKDALRPDWRLVLVHQAIPKRTFYRWHGQISLPFHILQQVNSVAFHIPEAYKKYPFQAQPPCIGHYQ